MLYGQEAMLRVERGDAMNGDDAQETIRRKDPVDERCKLDNDILSKVSSQAKQDGWVGGGGMKNVEPGGRRGTKGKLWRVWMM